MSAVDKHREVAWFHWFGEKSLTWEIILDYQAFSSGYFLEKTSKANTSIQLIGIDFVFVNGIWTVSVVQFTK